MHETPEGLVALQAVIDRGFAAAGPHLLSIVRPERRVSAAELVQRLQGMCLLALATTTADGRPLVGPIDGVFYRGAFHFGTDPSAVGWRHIQARPHVSATHLPSEEFAATVHGRAVPVSTSASEGAGLRRALLEVYVPRYGAEFEQFLDSGPVYARIEPDKLFTFAIR